MSQSNEVVSEVVKKPTLKYKFREYTAVTVWTLRKLVDAGLIPIENIDAIYAQIMMFSTVDAQTAFYEAFMDTKNESIKTVAKIVKDHNKPPKVARENKVVVDDTNKPKRGRSKKVVVKVDSQEDDVIAQLIAAANNTENIVISPVVVEVPVPVVEVPVVEVPVPVKSKKGVVNADEKAAAKIKADEDKAAAKIKADEDKAAAKIKADEDKAAAKIKAEQEKVAKTDAAAKAKAVKEAEKAAKVNKKAAPVVVVAPVVAELEEEVVRDGDDSESEDGYELECTPYEQDGKEYLCADNGDVYDTESNPMEDLIFVEGRIQTR